MFDELFPRSASRFSSFALSSGEWVDGMSERDLEFQWALALFADELLKRAASYREAKDLFVTSKFMSKFSLFRQERATMASRKKVDPIVQEDKAEWKGFLDYRLSDAELEELDSWKPRPTDVFAEVDAAITTGFRFTLTYNLKTKLASCTIICDDASKRYGGYALSSSDEDGAGALKMAIFKHVKLGRVWDELVGKDVPRGRRG